MCPIPSNPMNGMYNCPMGADGVLSYEDICTLMCDPGYEVDGNEMRTCQSNGSFSGTDATCSLSMYIGNLAISL